MHENTENKIANAAKRFGKSLVKYIAEFTLVLLILLLIIGIVHRGLWDICQSGMGYPDPNGYEMTYMFNTPDGIKTAVKTSAMLYVTNETITDDAGTTWMDIDEKDIVKMLDVSDWPENVNQKHYLWRPNKMPDENLWVYIDMPDGSTVNGLVRAYKQNYRRNCFIVIIGDTLYSMSLNRVTLSYS